MANGYMKTIYCGTVRKLDRIEANKKSWLPNNYHIVTSAKYKSSKWNLGMLSHLKLWNRIAKLPVLKSLKSYFSPTCNGIYQLHLIKNTMGRYMYRDL